MEAAGGEELDEQKRRQAVDSPGQFAARRPHPLHLARERLPSGGAQSAVRGHPVAAYRFALRV